MATPDVSTPWRRERPGRGLAQAHWPGTRLAIAVRVAEPGEGDRDIGLGAADMDVEPAALQQQFAPRRGQPQQQFAEAKDLPGQRALPSRPV